MPGRRSLLECVPSPLGALLFEGSSGTFIFLVGSGRPEPNEVGFLRCRGSREPRLLGARLAHREGPPTVERVWVRLGWWRADRAPCPCSG